jgi:hypothetical protein
MPRRPPQPTLTAAAAGASIACRARERGGALGEERPGPRAGRRRQAQLPPWPRQAQRRGSPRVEGMVARHLNSVTRRAVTMAVPVSAPRGGLRWAAVDHTVPSSADAALLYYSVLFFVRSSSEPFLPRRTENLLRGSRRVAGASGHPAWQAIGWALRPSRRMRRGLFLPPLRPSWPPYFLRCCNSGPVHLRRPPMCSTSDPSPLTSELCAREPLALGG